MAAIATEWCYKWPCAWPRPFRHPETGIFWFRKAVPIALGERVGKREISQSLATRDPDTAKERAAPLEAEWNTGFKSLQSGVTVLTQKQIVRSQAASAMPTAVCGA